MDSILEAPTGLAEEDLFRRQVSGPTFGMVLSDEVVLGSVTGYTMITRDEPRQIRIRRSNEWMRPVALRLVELATDPNPAGIRAHFAAVDGAARTLVELMRRDTVRPSILATPDGGVTAEWLVNGIEFGLEFEADGRITAWFEDPESEEEWEGDLTETLSQVLRVFSRLELQS